MEPDGVVLLYECGKKLNVLIILLIITMYSHCTCKNDFLNCVGFERGL